MSVFDNRASEWDKKPRRVKLSRDVVSAIIERSGIKTGSDVADFGTGTGLILLGLAEYAKSLTGFDFSDGMLKVLKEKADEAVIENLTTVQMDIYKDDFPKENFDIMTGNMVMHHLKDPKVLVEKAHGALRTGGKLCLSDLVESENVFHDDVNADFEHNGFQPEEMIKMMRESGFKNVSIDTAAIVEKERDGEKIHFHVFLVIGEK